MLQEQQQRKADMKALVESVNIKVMELGENIENNRGVVADLQRETPRAQPISAAWAPTVTR